MPPLVAEGVELFGVTQIEAGLFADPFAQARFQCAVMGGIEGAEGQGVIAVLMA